MLKAFEVVSGIEEPEANKTEGFHGNPIIIYHATTKSPKAIEAFWSRVKEAGMLDEILEGLDRRIDEECYLHVRFDKQEAYQGRMKVVNHDDVIVVKAKVAAYPARRERAVEVARSYLHGE